MNTNNNSVEELINTINPNTLQCSKCKKWISKDKSNNYNDIKFYDVCTNCIKLICNSIKDHKKYTPL